jgi:hypothetical protein
LRAGAILLAVALIAGAAGAVFRTQSQPDEVRPAATLSEMLHLSDFNPLLRGTPGDTEIYVFKGAEPGGALLVLGGTHANEIAGVMTAVLMVENLAVDAGSIYVLPRANASAASHCRPREAQPSSFAITTPCGARVFRHGTRFTNPRHQRPDPALFRHPSSSALLAGQESRNLNRVYPGVRDGTLTERVAWAVVELIRRKRIDLAFDLHEAPPDRKLANTIVAPEVSQDLAAEAAIMLQLDGWDIRVEASSSGFHGLSHREWADATSAHPFLLETANPAQGRLRGRTSPQSAVTGLDPMYLAAAEAGRLAVPYGSGGIPLESRVARNLATIAVIVGLHGDRYPERSVRYRLPGPDVVQREGVGAFLSPPVAAASTAPDTGQRTGWADSPHSR